MTEAELVLLGRVLERLSADPVDGVYLNREDGDWWAIFDGAVIVTPEEREVLIKLIEMGAML